MWCVLDAVAEFDLSAFRDCYRSNGQGGAAFDPELMVSLLLYCYSLGERSSRAIERRCVEDIACRVICGGRRPDHATIARFRVRHEQSLAQVFTQVLRLLGAAGLVQLHRISLDGTKIGANAAWSANKTLDQIDAILAEAAAIDAAEDAEHGTARGDETPRQLAGRADRRARLVQARERLATEMRSRTETQEAKKQAWEDRRASGKFPGRKPNDAPPQGTRAGKPLRANVTDPQARTMKSKHTLLVGYNAQAVVTDTQIIVGTLVTQEHVDTNLLHTVLDTSRTQLTTAGIKPKLHTVLADAGYATEAAFATADAQKLRLLSPLAKDTRAFRDGGDPAAGKNLSRLPHTAAAQRRLRHWKGRADYRQRGRTVEPVFGQIKTCLGLTRFSRRGLSACQSEWSLTCAAHNLRKLHRHR